MACRRKFQGSSHDRAVLSRVPDGAAWTGRGPDLQADFNGVRRRSCSGRQVWGLIQDCNR